MGGRLDAEHGMKRGAPPSEACREQGSGMRPSLAAGGKTRAHSMKVRVSDADVPHLGACRSHFWVREHTRINRWNVVQLDDDPVSRVKIPLLLAPEQQPHYTLSCLVTLARQRAHQERPSGQSAHC